MSSQTLFFFFTKSMTWMGINELITPKNFPIYVIDFLSFVFFFFLMVEW